MCASTKTLMFIEKGEGCKQNPGKLGRYMYLRETGNKWNEKKMCNL